jgi:dUTP pyrophosphatase
MPRKHSSRKPVARSALSSRRLPTSTRIVPQTSPQTSKVTMVSRPAAARSISIRVVRLPHGQDLPLPTYQTDGAAGMDLLAALPATRPLRLKRFERALVPTGLILELPRNTEGQVRPRSGLALKQGITVLNAPGTIDSDYRGEVQVLLINLGRAVFTIQRGDRIAQLVIQAVARGTLREAATTRKSLRGVGGFGSTGVTGAEKPQKKIAKKRTASGKKTKFKKIKS